MTPAEIEPVTFRIVAQHLNHCATAVPGGKYNYHYCVMCHEYREGVQKSRDVTGNT